MSHFPKYWGSFANKRITRDVNPVSGKNDATALRNILKDNYKTIRRFKYFQIAVVMMFWYLEHWWILYRKQPHKLRRYVIALMILCQQTMSTLCSYSKLAQFTRMKLLAIIAVTWDNRDNTFKRKNFRKTFRDLSFLCIGCISTWCLRKKQFWKK